MTTAKRYYELDWLRVILILAVFIHHCLMPFNGDNWHIMNNQHSRLLDDVMVYFEQLRLPMLFFIAGAGAFVLLDKQKTAVFLKDKIWRLLLPLIVSVLVIVPPQSYIEHIDDYTSYLSAYPALLLNFDTNHLWFIEFLLVFMLFAIPLYKALAHSLVQTFIGKVSKSLVKPSGILLIGLTIASVRILLKLHYPDNSHSLFNPAISLFYLAFFALGMLFISDPSRWKSIQYYRRTNLLLLTIISVLFYAYYLLDFSPYFGLQTRWSIWWFMSTMVSWTGLVAAVGYAQHYLSHDAKYLRRSNQLIYPFYVLHQTIIIILGFWVISLNASILLKSILLVTTSLAVTIAICCYAIAPFKLTRLLFGLRSAS